MNLLPIKKYKEKLKQRCISRHNKQQLNDVFFSLSNEVYLKIKNKKHYTTTDIVY